MPEPTPALTPGQTVGPFFGYALPLPDGERLAPEGAPGTVRLSGVVRDGEGRPVPDALIELWQCDADGSVVQREGSLRRSEAVFTGWGRAATDDEGRYAFWTEVPEAPFFSVVVFARGLLHCLFTRAYLPYAGDAPLLTSLPAERARTLLARPVEDGFVFDIHLQGPDETVFLDFSDAEPRG